MHQVCTSACDLDDDDGDDDEHNDDDGGDGSDDGDDDDDDEHNDDDDDDDDDDIQRRGGRKGCWGFEAKQRTFGKGFPPTDWSPDLKLSLLASWFFLYLFILFYSKIEKNKIKKNW